MTKQYFRLMLGPKSAHADECIEGSFVGVDYKLHENLSGKLPEQWRDFNKRYIPLIMKIWPEKNKISAGLACGAIWTVSKGMNEGDLVLCSDGAGAYHVGCIAGRYQYAEGGILPHRRPVEWLGVSIARDDMSEGLRNSAGSIGTVSNITKHAEEIVRLLEGQAPAAIISTDETIEDPAAFAMEKHLEDFLVRNWASTRLGREYDIYEDESDGVGQQFPTDTGPIDILAMSKDRKTLLVVELKKGRASDVVVGQVLRYMGFVQEELADDSQTVRGVVIALDNDQRLKRALAMVPAVDFWRYKVSFELIAGDG